MNARPLRLTSLAVALVAIGLSLSAQTSVTDPGPGPDRGPMAEGREFRDLKLTEAQRAKVKAIHASHRAALKAKGDAAEAAHRALGAALADGATDLKTLRALHDKASTAQFELLLEHRVVRQEILPLLTPEQRTQFEKQPLGMPPHGGPGLGPGFRGPRPGGPSPQDLPGPEAPPVKPS
jgi:Spy/CpxP family protein refolding chaperone